MIMLTEDEELPKVNQIISVLSDKLINSRSSKENASICWAERMMERDVENAKNKSTKKQNLVHFI